MNILNFGIIWNTLFKELLRDYCSEELELDDEQRDLDLDRFLRDRRRLTGANSTQRSSSPDDFDSIRRRARCARTRFLLAAFSSSVNSFSPSEDRPDVSRPSEKSLVPPPDIDAGSSARDTSLGARILNGGIAAQPYKRNPVSIYSVGVGTEGIVIMLGGFLQQK